MKNIPFHPASLSSILDELSLWSAPFGMKLLDAVPLHSRMQVLDIGCGTGFPLIELAMRLGSEARLTGLDPEKSFLDRAQEKINAWNLTNVSLIEGVAEDIPFGENTFDLVVSNNGLNNVQNLQQCLHEIKRTGKKDASLLFTMNTSGSFEEFYGILREALILHSCSDRIPLIKEHIREKRPPHEYMCECLQKAGISLSSVEHDNFAMRYANGDSFLSHGFVRIAFLPSWLQVIGEKQEEVLQSVKEIINRQCKNDGAFKVTIPFSLYSCVL